MDSEKKQIINENNKQILSNSLNRIFFHFMSIEIIFQNEIQYFFFVTYLF